MKTTDFKDVLNALKSVGSGRILLVTHERPDGDAIGSLFGLCTLLNDNGFSADALFPEEAPDFYKSFLPATFLKSIDAETLNRYDLLLNVDASTVKRLGLSGNDFHELKRPMVTLDHHPDNELFAALSCICSTACSTAEIIFGLAEYAHWKIAPAAATFLLLGLTTDSGCFRFDNTTPDSHRAAAALLELGAEHHKIIEKVYLSKPMNMVLYEADMLCNHLFKAFGGRFVCFYLEPSLLEKYSVDLRNTENLIDTLRGIDGVEIAALLKPQGTDGCFKISLRSKNPALSVGKIARRLNGGGHEMAAGGSIPASSPEEARTILIQQVEKELNEASAQ